jgi:FRG domain-containing protein
MADPTAEDSRQRTGSIRELLEQEGSVPKVSSLAEFVSVVREVSEGWQAEDWRGREDDEEYLLNNTRLVGQAWFRGHRSTDMSLQPGLYREFTRLNLNKLSRSSRPHHDVEDHLLSELFSLEHELRIDFTSFGRLLDQVGHAKSAIDWYFLMQHHGVPTRLLDWTSNALAALFFSLEGHSQQGGSQPDPEAITSVAVWMIDAYWLAMRLDEDWYGPILPWSEEAAKYVPPLEKLLESMHDSLALVPSYAMPIEPAAIHSRVAAQEGKFIIFGRTRDLLDHRIRLENKGDEDCEMENLRVRQIQFDSKDPDSILRDLAQLGVSRRTLFPDLDGLSSFVRWKHFHKITGYNLELPGR